IPTWCRIFTLGQCQDRVVSLRRLGINVHLAIDPSQCRLNVHCGLNARMWTGIDASKPAAPFRFTFLTLDSVFRSLPGGSASLGAWFNEAPSQSPSTSIETCLTQLHKVKGVDRHQANALQAWRHTSCWRK